MFADSLTPSGSRLILIRVPGVACYALTPGYCLSHLRREDPPANTAGTNLNQLGVRRETEPSLTVGLVPRSLLTVRLRFLAFAFSAFATTLPIRLGRNFLLALLF